MALQEALENVPLLSHMTTCDATHSLKILNSTFNYQVHNIRYAKRHSNSLKPHLTPENKAARLEFSKLFVLDAIASNIDLMMDVIHIDKKFSQS